MNKRKFFGVLGKAVLGCYLALGVKELGVKELDVKNIPNPLYFDTEDLYFDTEDLFYSLPNYNIEIECVECFNPELEIWNEKFKSAKTQELIFKRPSSSCLPPIFSGIIIKQEGELIIES